MAQEAEKEAVGKYAVNMIDDGMLVGLGTGSTAKYIIEELIKKRNDGSLPNVRCVCTSIASENLARSGGIPICDASLAEPIDITFDGADLVNNKIQLVKGGGGALLREKLVALRSKVNIVMVDYTKVSDPLQGRALPLELVAWGHEGTIHRLRKLGYKGKLRPGKSDNGNLLFDIEYDCPICDPIAEHETLKGVTGVIETGFFFDTSELALVGEKDLTVRRMKKVG